MAQDLKIDMHAHFYGGGLDEMLHNRQRRPFLRHREDGSQGMVAMNGEFPFKSSYFDHRVGLAQMDVHGLSHRLLTFPGALGLDVLPAAEVMSPIRAFNTRLAELFDISQGRLLGLGGLPLDDMSASGNEVRRIRRDLRLPGIILPSNYFNTIEEARSLAPILSAANEEGCHILLHPGLKVGESPPPVPSDNIQYRVSAVALQAQASQAVLTLILSDIPETYPNISFQVVNLGGTVPFIFERMESIARHRTPDLPFPTARLRNLWYDCASLGPRALEAAVKVLGADCIMLGSDYPIFADDPYSHAVLPADLEDEDKKKIAGGNAMTLLQGLGVKMRGQSWV